MMVQEAAGRIRDMGMTLRVKDGEYRVNYLRGTEATAYYTNSLADAIATADAMRAHQQATGRMI